MDELYAEYGKLMVQQELLNAQINAVKTKLAAELNKPKTESHAKETNLGETKSA